MAKKRDYKKEYREYHGKPEQRKRRSSRNKARRKVDAEGRDVEGKDVDHKDGDPLNNASSNLRVESKHRNRARKKKAYTQAVMILRHLGSKHNQKTHTNRFGKGGTKE
ncbi:MAG: HNH endonuclease [Chloroflexi bacterium]|nr:HNH endonuclease [Chloroflexota bacterium]